MKVSVLTASGGRPQQLDWCRKMVARQDFIGEIEHIVSEDESLDVARNLLWCLERATGQACVVFEDDDWYPPTWVTTSTAMLAGVAIFGVSETNFYHVPARSFRTMLHDSTKRPSPHSSLFCTSWIREANPLVENTLRAMRPDDSFVDHALWRAFANHPHRLVRLDALGAFPCGIKGLPGRRGAGNGHEGRGYIRDPNGEQLERWVGKADALMYLDWPGLE